MLVSYLGPAIPLSVLYTQQIILISRHLLDLASAVLFLVIDSRF